MSDELNIENGVVLSAVQRPSPNFNARPKGAAIELLVIHNISLPPSCFGGTDIEDFFQNKLDVSKDPFYQEIATLRVSAHLLIKRSGELVQFVNLNDRAWHAGVSDYCGRTNCNDFSIGIELEGDDFSEFTAAQYQRLASVSLALSKAYPGITAASTCGHSDIAPGRKTDPGPFFEWAHYRALWASYMGG